MINGNACFAYFNKIWGIPELLHELGDSVALLTVYESGKLVLGEFLRSKRISPPL